MCTICLLLIGAPAQPRNRASSASDFLQNSLFEIAPVFLNVGIGAVYIASVYGFTVGAVLLGTGACYLVASLITRPTQIAYRTKVSSHMHLQ